LAWRCAFLVPPITLELIAGIRSELYREINQRYTDEIWDYDLKDFFPSQGKGSEPSTPSRSNGTALSSANANIFIEDEDAFLESLMNAARFFMTSVHDSSLQEAWGRVMQSLMGPLYGPIEGLMSTFARVSTREVLRKRKILTFLSRQTNNMEKAFLFDINAKFNVAADDSITETKNFHLSTDYIGKMLAFQSLFECVRPLQSAMVTDLSFAAGNFPRQGKRRGASVSETRRMKRRNRTSETSSGRRKLSGCQMENVSSTGKYRSKSFCIDPRGTHVDSFFPRRLALLGACSAAEYDKMQGMMEFNVVLLRQGILDMLEAGEDV
jgi:Ras-related GTP-binding protein C/D